MSDFRKLGRFFFSALAVLLCGFILAEVNYPVLTPQSQLAIFAMLGLLLVFHHYPLPPQGAAGRATPWIDRLLMAGVLLAFGYVFVQSEPLFQSLWPDGQPLGNRAGIEQPLDYWMGLLGLLLVLEATRRTIGITLPLLSLLFIAYAAFGPAMPEWLFPHRGYPWQRIVSQTFLHSQGVFGIALKVMFTYVFLFVLFGTLLEETGATQFIIDFARRIFGSSAGGPAKVAVLSSGLMGSLSGSAVANTATTGTFTIPLMRSAGFKPEIAGGIEAAASSGGALVPPIMGAGAYMMLEIVEPPVTYLAIIRAALIPAILYYAALLLIVHFQAKRIGAHTAATEESVPQKLLAVQGGVFLIAFLTLIGLLVAGYTPFRAVSLSLLAIWLASLWRPESRVTPAGIVRAMQRAARSGIPLIAAASSVGIIIGIVTLTGIGAKLPATLLPLAQNNLLLALLILMISTIILGMGLPSAVCYLLMATFIGPILDDLGLVPLAAHLFIFYFGMMSMVTPPVALAAYTAAAIAGSGIMQTGFAAFRFALIGFALPYAFVLRPELLLLTPSGESAALGPVLLNVSIAAVGIVALAAGITGYWFATLSRSARAVLIAAAFIFLLTPSHQAGMILQLTALVGVGAVGTWSWKERRAPARER